MFLNRSRSLAFSALANPTMQFRPEPVAGYIRVSHIPLPFSALPRNFRILESITCYSSPKPRFVSHESYGNSVVTKHIQVPAVQLQLLSLIFGSPPAIPISSVPVVGKGSLYLRLKYPVLPLVTTLA